MFPIFTCKKTIQPITTTSTMWSKTIMALCMQSLQLPVTIHLPRTSTIHCVQIHEHHLRALRASRHLPDPGHQRLPQHAQYLQDQIWQRGRRILPQGEKIIPNYSSGHVALSAFIKVKRSAHFITHSFINALFHKLNSIQSFATYLYKLVCYNFIMNWISTYTQYTIIKRSAIALNWVELQSVMHSVNMHYNISWLISSQLPSKLAMARDFELASTLCSRLLRCQWNTQIQMTWTIDGA